MDGSAERILGIDPGLNITGYGVVERHPQKPRLCEAGVIRGGTGTLGERLFALHQGVVEIIEQFRPQIMIVEQLYSHYKHPRTAILMGHARGAIFLAAAAKDIEIVSYAATRIKKTITGHGRASKEQMQRTIQGELNLAQIPDPPDVADALAAALCHYFTR